MTTKEMSFLDFLFILTKWKRLLIYNFLIISVIAVVVSLILPKYYRATAVFLPPARNSGLASIIENFSVDILGGSDITGEDCLSILNSRELRQKIIDRYDLMTLYDRDYVEHVLLDLEDNVEIESELMVGIGTTSVSSVSLSVIDESPQRAADMANDFLALLENKIVELNTLKAGNNRRFLQQRVADNVRDLTTAEDSLKAFQMRYGAIEITEQAKVAIAAAAQIKSEMLTAEITREALVRQLSPNHVEIAKLDNQIIALQKKYSELHQSNEIVRNENDVLIPIDKIPAIGLQYYRHLREVEIQNAVFKMLVPLLEQAKIQESKTIPVLRVVDHAVPPTYKYKPKRAIIVLAIVGVSMAFLCLYIFFVEYVQRIRETDTVQHNKLMALKENLRLRKSTDDN